MIIGGGIAGIATALYRLRDDFAAALPGLGRLKLWRAWAGMIDVTPDQVPVPDETGLPGFFIATGCSGHGIGIGIGQLTARLMTGRAPGHDLARFRFARFSDGSAVEIGRDLWPCDAMEKGSS